MREILFKAKRLDNGEWVEGFLFTRKNTLNEIIDCFIFEDAYEQVAEGQRFVRSNLNYECFRVDPETVCQFTGATDCVGNKVWENDVVDINVDVRKMFNISGGKVRYIGETFVVGDGDGLINSLMALVDIYYCLRGIVVGNVFDNPQPIIEF